MDLIHRYDPYQAVEIPQIGDAAAAMQALCDGNDRFTEFARRMQERTLGGDAGEPIVVPVSPITMGLPLFPGVALRQTPFALVLGCSDARAPVEAIFDRSFNDLFVLRVAGNVLGTEGLGSIDYAVKHLGESLKLIVVLGHSGCGAVTAAVDAYLSPDSFAEIAFTHSLRSLVDRIQLAARAAAKALGGDLDDPARRSPEDREALIEAAVYLNAALTAYDLRREVRSLGADDLPVVYGVYDLSRLRVRSLPRDRRREPTSSPYLAAAPESTADFTGLGREIADRLRGDAGATPEGTCAT